MTRAIFVLALLAGCPDPELRQEVWLHAATGAPPSGRAVVINNDHGGTYAIELSAGVAIAAFCTSTCGASCVPAVSAADPRVLDVRPVYRVNGAAGQIALIAKQPGATELLVDTTCGARTYLVQVTAP